jgi:hypothetical protein
MDFVSKRLIQILERYFFEGKIENIWYDDDGAIRMSVHVKSNLEVP